MDHQSVTNTVVRPDLWRKVEYLSFRLRREDFMPLPLYKLIKNVLTRTHALRSLCIF